MSFPRYPKYKASHVDWLSELPEHWESIRLKTLLAEVDERAEDQHLELLGLSKALGVVKRSELEQGASVSDDYGKYKVAAAGHLVMNKMQAWNGVFGLSPMRGIVSPDYAVFRFIRPGFDDFLCSLFRTEVMAGMFFTRCRGMGTAFLRLNSPDFLDIRVPLPPVEDAQRIRLFLDRETAKIDALVAEQRRLIDLLKEKREAVISHAVTKGLNPHASMKPSGVEWLGDVPRHWEVTRVKYATKMTADCPHETPDYSEEGDYLVIRTADVEVGRLLGDEMYRVNEAEYQRRIRRSSLEAGDVVYTREGERWGLSACIPVGGRYCLGQRMFQLRAASHFSSEFLMWHLSASCVYRQAEVDTVGATAPHINLSTIRNFLLVNPPQSEQRVISAFLGIETAKLDELTAEARRAIDLLQERRTALISAAVTGKIDVRGLVETEAA